METSRISKLFDTNLFARIFSIFVAVILWAYVSFIVDPETQKEITKIPVKFLNEQTLLESGLTLVNKEYYVSAQVKGRRNILSGLNTKRIWAEVDLAVYTKPGKNIVGAKINGLPSSVEIIKEPQDILIELDKAHMVQKDISVIINGEPKEGYAVFNPVVKPTSVKIEGSKNIINTIGQVAVIVEVSGLENTFVSKEKVSIIDVNGKEIKNLKSSIELAEVTIPVVRAKQVPVKVNLIGTPDNNVVLDKVKITPQSVVITGSDEVLKRVTELNIEPIDISHANSNIYTNSKIVKPKDIQLINSTNSAKVEISFKKPITQILTITKSDIKIVDVNANYQYELTDDKLKLTLQGFEENLLDIEDKMSITISAKDLQLGDNVVPLKITLPDGVRKTSELTTVQIKVKAKE